MHQGLIMVSWWEILCTHWADSEIWSGDAEVRWLPYGIAPKQFSWVSSWIPGPRSPSSGLLGVSFALLSPCELPTCASYLEQRKICMSMCDPWPNHGKNGGWTAMSVLSDSHSWISRALLVVLPHSVTWFVLDFVLCICESMHMPFWKGQCNENIET